jgi:hypothetical protein
MGSTGSGTFGNYPPSGTTRCDQAIDTDLEDVATQAYFSQMRTVPPLQTGIRLRPRGPTGRLVVEDLAGQAIGNLPTRFNYLFICQSKGYSYEGQVTVSRTGAIPVVEVHLEPV